MPVGVIRSTPFPPVSTSRTFRRSIRNDCRLGRRTTLGAVVILVALLLVVGAGVAIVFIGVATSLSRCLVATPFGMKPRLEGRATLRAGAPIGMMTLREYC